VAAPLTFAQVKQAKTFAWNANGYLYVDGRVLVHIQPVNDPTHLFRVSSLRDSDEVLPDEWYHLPDCTCAFCRG